MMTSTGIQISLPAVYLNIAPFLQEIRRRRPVIVEIGMHHGTDSNLLRAMCVRPPYFFGFEPDPRNAAALREAGHFFMEAAVGAREGSTTMYLSGGMTPGADFREHTDSSSIKRPTKHLDVFPWCRFDREVTVPVVTLDAAIPKDMKPDLVWCDVQGAQLDVIEGGARTLANTRWLFIEVHPTPLYEGEPTRGELHQALEEATKCRWTTVESYVADVLLEKVEG